MNSCLELKSASFSCGKKFSMNTSCFSIPPILMKEEMIVIKTVAKNIDFLTPHLIITHVLTHPLFLET